MAWYEDRDGDFELVAKFVGQLWTARIDHSPLDVVAWHGNHAPYKYDLRRFNTIGSISYDHPDPSIFLVLQSLSDTPGVDTLDFVIFPPRWLVMQNTFRPPWFHRNVASEFMGLIAGVYDAKAQGFVPGGRVAAQLHERARSRRRHLEKAMRADTSQPLALADTMAFMFETRSVIRPTRFALGDAAAAARLWQVWPSCAALRPSGHRSGVDPARSARAHGADERAQRDARSGAAAAGSSSANVPGDGFPDPEPAVRASSGARGSSDSFRGGVAIGDQVLDLGALHRARRASRGSRRRRWPPARSRR